MEQVIVWFREDGNTQRQHSSPSYPGKDASREALDGRFRISFVSSL